MDLIDPDPDPWTTSQIDLRPVLSVRSCLLIRGQYLTLVTITRPLPDLWINFLAWPQPSFITVRLPVPQAASLVWRPGQWAGPSCWFWACPAPSLVACRTEPLLKAWLLPCQPFYQAWLPVLRGAGGVCCLLTLTWEYIFSPLAWPKARAIRKAELGCAGLVPFPHTRRAVSLLILPTSLRLLTPTVFKNADFPRKMSSVVTHLTIADSQLKQGSRKSRIMVERSVQLKVPTQ